jgi:hypothetical protein
MNVLVMYGSRKLQMALLIAARHYAPIAASESNEGSSSSWEGPLHAAVLQDPAQAAENVALVARGSSTEGKQFKKELLDRLTPKSRSSLFKLAASEWPRSKALWETLWDEFSPKRNLEEFLDSFAKFLRQTPGLLHAIVVRPSALCFLVRFVSSRASALKKAWDLLGRRSCQRAQMHSRTSPRRG